MVNNTIDFLLPQKVLPLRLFGLYPVKLFRTDLIAVSCGVFVVIGASYGPEYISAERQEVSSAPTELW